MNRSSSIGRRGFARICARSAAAAFVITGNGTLHATPADDATKNENTRLFASDRLDGWEPTDFFRPGEVTIRDGIVTLGRGNPMTGLTITRKNLPRSDFELSYEARRVEGDDFFAAATFPVDDGFLTFVNGGWSGNVTGLSSIDGADASENETGSRVEFENGQWYRFVIQVAGRKVKVRVDGKIVVDFDGTDRSLKTRVESRPSQPLGFAAFGCVGQIRSAALRQLAD
jgi:hypothetical protein